MTTHSPWIRDGYHLNSTYWQQYKRTLPPLSPYIEQCLWGMCLGDAHIARTGRHAYVKFEQGAAQVQLMSHLFRVFH